MAGVLTLSSFVPRQLIGAREPRTRHPDGILRALPVGTPTMTLCWTGTVTCLILKPSHGKGSTANPDQRWI
jgi:hypothetical protein